jgi:hypothetical protein
MVQRRIRRKDPLGERIFMCNGDIVDSPDVNHSVNINAKKVECSCGSILLRSGYSYHIKRDICIEYHKLVRYGPFIKQYLL